MCLKCQSCYKQVFTILKIISNTPIEQIYLKTVTIIKYNWFGHFEHK